MKSVSFSFLLKTFASQVWISWNADANPKTQSASLSQAPEQQEQPDCLKRGQKVSISPPYRESMSFLDSFSWRTWQDIRKGSLILDIPHVWRGGMGKKEQNRKQVILWFCEPRGASQRRYEKVWWEIATRRPWPLTLLISTLWIVSNTNIEADLSSAAINKFNSKNHCSNANLYKLKMWLVRSLLLEFCTSQMFSGSFLIWSGQ